MKSIWIAAVLLAALYQASALAQPADAERRGVSVGGQGEVRTLPDRARLALAVDLQGPALAEAEAEVNRIVRRYVEQLRAEGVEERHLRSTAVQIQPEYSWDDKTRRQLLTGYRARRDLVLEVQDLGRLGDWILAATAAGLNHVAPPELYSSQAEALHKQALARAAEDARDQAGLLAQTLGMRLGPVRRLVVQDQAAPPIAFKAALRSEALGDSGNAAMGLQTGELVYQATVQADFDLLPAPRGAR
jgi:uncharacterized protein